MNWRTGDRLPVVLCIAAVLIGLECLVLFQPWNDVGVDFDRVLTAGQIWRAGGDPYGLPGYLYSPAMTAVASLIPTGTWIVWAAAEIGLVVILAPRDRWALLVAATWPGVWLDVALGNVTIALVAAGMLAITIDRTRAGMPLGLALALAPKPMFGLFLVWMALHRRRSALGVVAGAAIGTAAGIVIAGAGSYATFVRALVTGVDPHFVGNSGLSYISPTLGLAAFIVVALVSLRLVRAPADGIMAAAIAGTFAGTYVGLYSTILPMAVLPRFAATRPVASRRLAMAGLFAPFALWVAGIAATALLLWPGDERRSSLRPRSRSKVANGPSASAE